MFGRFCLPRALKNLSRGRRAKPAGRGKVFLRLCKKFLRLVPPALHGFWKGHSAQPRALFKEGHCTPVTFYTTTIPRGRQHL